ncbi:hypothetical protein ABW21_db0205341 [Orbilia brochopaga]|nr:hypothetical protein ABW21_db0205341 [Drechslerella brochopaga]
MKLEALPADGLQNASSSGQSKQKIQTHPMPSGRSLRAWLLAEVLKADPVDMAFACEARARPLILITTDQRFVDGYGEFFEQVSVVVYILEDKRRRVFRGQVSQDTRTWIDCLSRGGVQLTLIYL